MRIEKLQNNYDIAIEWVAFPLHPEIPEEGMDLIEIYGTEENLRNKNAQMEELMREEGLPFRSRNQTWNSRLAQELSKWAESQPGGGAIHDALFRAYFAEGLNISDPEVLVSVAESIGLDGSSAHDILETRSFSGQVDADWQLAQQIGLTGVPTFIAERRAVVGAQTYEILEHLVQIALKERSP